MTSTYSIPTVFVLLACLVSWTTSHLVDPILSAHDASHHLDRRAFLPGNYVITNRTTGRKEYEEIPQSVRFGMKLLFDTPLVHAVGVKSLLAKATRKMGKRYNSPESKKDIPEFIKTYGIDVNELLEPDVAKYPTYNAFFSRKLKPGARKIDWNPNVLVSPADCRAVVYDSISEATTFWIKGKEFSLSKLLGLKQNDVIPDRWKEGSVAVLRLAPQDYHRIHAATDASIVSSRDIEGAYYTVNPVAIQRSDLDVLGSNRRHIVQTESPRFGKHAYIFVGALLVGSIKLSDRVHVLGDVVKGDTMGWFEFGGSTVVMLFEKGRVAWDNDLVEASRKGVETRLKMGERIGVTSHA